MTSSQTMASDLNGKFHEVSRGTTAATTTIESCDCLTDTYVTWGENLGILLVYIVLSPNLTVIHVDIHHITMVMSHTNIHKPCNFTIQLSDFITTTLCLILPTEIGTIWDNDTIEIEHLARRSHRTTVCITS